MERYWLIYDGTGSAEGGNGRYLVVLGQKKAWLTHDGTGSVWGGTGWYLVVLGQ